ncbi:MAG: hypothetical protein ACKVOE_09545 [Rickettsiales bacterium]
MTNPIVITQTERDAALSIAKSLTTHLSDADEVKVILAGLMKAKNQGFKDDTPEQTARKASQGVVQYLREHNLVLPEAEQKLLVFHTKVLANEIVQGR